MVILDVQGESFAMKLLKGRGTGVVDEHKPACLFPVNILGAKAKTNQTYIGEEPNKASVYIKVTVMSGTQKQAITRIMSGMILSLFRDPITTFEAPPLGLTSVLVKRLIPFDSQFLAQFPG